MQLRLEPNAVPTMRIFAMMLKQAPHVLQIPWRSLLPPPHPPPPLPGFGFARQLQDAKGAFRHLNFLS